MKYKHIRKEFLIHKPAFSGPTHYIPPLSFHRKYGDGISKNVIPAYAGIQWA